MHGMRKAIFYSIFTAMIIGGTAVFLFCLLHLQIKDWLGVLFLAFLTTVANYVGEIRITRHYSVITDIIWIMAGTILFGPCVAVLVAGLARTIFCLWETKNKRHRFGLKVVWNILFCMFQAFLLSETFFYTQAYLAKVWPDGQQLGVFIDQIRKFWLPAVAVAIVDIFNMIILSLMVSLSTGKPFSRVFYPTLMLAPFQLLMMWLGIVVALVYQQIGFYATFLIGMAALLIQYGYLSYNKIRENQDFWSAELEGVIRAIPTGVVATDEEWQVIHFNPAAEELTGLGAKKMVGARLTNSPLMELLGLELPLTLQEISLQAKEIREVKVRVEGENRHLAYRLTPYYSQKNEHLGFLLTLWDITPVKELIEAKGQVSRLMVFNQVAVAMADGMRNPVSIIRQHAQRLGEILCQPMAESDLLEGRKRLQQIIKEGDRLSEIIQGLIGEPFSCEYQPEVIDLVSLLEETTRVFKDELCRSAAITWQLDLGNRELRVRPLVYGAREPLRRALIHIFLNAVEAMPSGGVLTVTISCLPEENRVILYISDTGVGINPCDLPRVFDPFYTTKKERPGLGLTVSSQIIEGMGGKIHLTSIPEHGTTVTVTLPLYQH